MQQQVQGMDAERRIVDAALKLFEEKGYHGTSLRDISKLAEVSKGAFYYYFQSKSQVLHRIHDEFVSRELSVAEGVLVADISAGEKLGRLITDILETVSLYRSHITVFFQERRFLDHDAFASVRQKRRRYQQIVQTIVEEGVRSGEVRSDIPAALTTLAFFGMANWSYQWFRPNSKYSYTEVSDAFTEILLNGVNGQDTEKPT